MNKFTALIAGLCVFAAVACLAASADNLGGLTNEIAEGQEVDGELEGGFKDSIAKKLVGVKNEDEWGRDILDEDKGLSQFAQKRTQMCKQVKNKDQCKTCCSGADKAYSYKFWTGLLSSKGCTCFDRDNNYATYI